MQSNFCLDIQAEGSLHRVEITFAKRWEGERLFERLKILPGQKIQLALEILEVSPDFVRLQVVSSLRLSYQRDQIGAAASAASRYDQPNLEQQVVTWMLRESVQGREEVTFSQAAAAAGVEKDETREVLARLVEQGFIREVEVNGETCYRPALAGRRAGRRVWCARSGPRC